MRNLGCFFAALAAIELFAARPIVVFNEDNSHMMRDAPAEEFVKYFDSVCRGGVTHFFMCPNCQRSNVDSKWLEPIWKALEEPGISPVWGAAAKALHDKGVDPYAIWAKRAREKSVSPWLSIRMNEVHEAQNPNCGLHGTMWRKHPELRRVPASDGRNWTDAALDYSHPEVREAYIGYVGEMLERYDVDGVEIDWLRFPRHLTPGLEPSQTNCLTAVMRAVRAHAEAAAKRWGHPVKVGARVETAEDTCLKLGEDPVFWAKEKLIDWLIVCNFFATANFDIPYREWTSRVHAVNPEVMIVPGLDSGVVKDCANRQFLTLAEYRGFCENLYAQGAPGVYIFNPFHFAADSAEWQAFTVGGLYPEQVKAVPRAYPVAYRESCANGAKNCMQLPRKLNEPVHVRLPIGGAPTRGFAELALAFDAALSDADLNKVALNGVLPRGWRRVETTSFLHPKTPAKEAIRLSYPLTALKAGYNEIDIPAVPVAKGHRTVFACELFIEDGKQARGEVKWTRTICSEKERYIGWPSVALLKNGDLMAVFSGDRERHVCPWGKVQMVRSSDQGETWTEAVTIANGPIDDRDAGIVQMPDGEIVVTYFTSIAYRTKQLLETDWKPEQSRYWWRRHDEKMTDEQRKAALGYYRISSRDNGRTWSKPEKLACDQTPHGPILLRDGSLFQIGRRFSESVQGAGEKGRTVITAWRSTDAGHTWECLCPDIPDMNGENSKTHMFHEPHAVELPNGDLLAMIRYHGADHCMRQSVSKDGGRTWSPMAKTPLLGLPPHLLNLPGGKTLCVFGRRFKEPCFGEYAVLSDDGGLTWDTANEILLTPGFCGDLGYPCSAILPNGDILTVYYQQPAPNAPCALMATKWRLR